MDRGNEIVERFVQDQDGPKFLGASGSSTGRKATPLPDFPGDSTAVLKISTDIPRKSSIVSNAVAFDQSTASSPSSRRGSVLSRRDTGSSVSTAPDPPEVPQHHFGPMYDCTIGFVGCEVQFQASDFENWYLHSLSHFGNSPLPRYTRCIFCDSVFENNDPRIGWRKRMRHIAEHMNVGCTVLEHSRPDFALINHMYREGIIESEVYRLLKETGNERPSLDGFRRYDHIPESIEENMRKEKDRENRIIVKDPRRTQREAHSKPPTRKHKAPK